MLISASKEATKQGQILGIRCVLHLLREGVMDGPMDGPTDGPTDLRTDGQTLL